MNIQKSMKLALVTAALLTIPLVAKEQEYKHENRHNHFTGAFTAGYVFKHDDQFKRVYGPGIINVITGDGCYSWCQRWGVGAKVSYWMAHGRTTFFQRETFIQEVPVTAYLRLMKNFRWGLRLYASLGGGALWVQEKSYLGCNSKWHGIGEAEIGMNYSLHHRLNFTSAFRYLFPRETVCGTPCERKVDVGGFDLRAGFSFIV
jgi:hypothetical protein